MGVASPTVLAVLRVGLTIAFLSACGSSRVDCPADMGPPPPPPDLGGLDSGIADAGEEPPMMCPAVCPDADGDGHLDARCGGDDCDDARATLYPGRSVCTGAAGVDRCDGRSAAHVDCPVDQPFCSSGRCVATMSGCGDGIVDASAYEQCDDGNPTNFDGCSRRCRVECRSSADCPSGATCGLMLLEASNQVCVATTTGGPGALGAACEDGLSCASRWCDMTQRRCTTPCSSDDQCPGGWCPLDATHDARGALANGNPNVCQFSCRSSADCAADRICLPSAWALVGTHFEFFTSCSGPLGTYATEARCSGDGNCAEGICIGYCSRLCVTDADCPATLPHCGTHGGFTYADGTAALICSS